MCLLFKSWTHVSREFQCLNDKALSNENSIVRINPFLLWVSVTFATQTSKNIPFSSCMCMWLFPCPISPRLITCIYLASPAKFFFSHFSHPPLHSIGFCSLNELNCTGGLFGGEKLKEQRALFVMDMYMNICICTRF